MGDRTSISWTDASWNPTRGCRRTVPSGSKQSGCGDASGGGCYAEAQAARFCGSGQAYEGLIKLTANGPRWSGKTKFVTNHLHDPLAWRRPRRIFVDSMSDLFYEEFTFEEIAIVYGVMLAARQHSFQILTKRPKRRREFFEWLRSGNHRARELGWTVPLHLLSAAARALEEAGQPVWGSHLYELSRNLHPWPAPNIWEGVSVENQAAADERVPELLATSAALRFLSIEPLLGPVNLDEWLFDPTGDFRTFQGRRQYKMVAKKNHGLHWAIVGCESGRKARPCHPEWIRELRDRFTAASVPLFLKQAEETADCGADGLPQIGDDESIGFGDGSRMKARRPGGNHILELPYLDGIQHANFPVVA